MPDMAFEQGMLDEVMPDTENITLVDVSLVVQIIDACSARGAFKGDELADVGALRNKMIAIAEKMKKDESKKPNKP